MKRIVQALLIIAAAGAAALGVAITMRPRTPAVAEPTLTFSGSLTSAELVPVSDSCGLRFQLFDASLGGNAVGDVVEIQSVPVTDGAFSLSTPASRLNGDNIEPSWLAIQVRCAQDEQYVSLAPRLRHHTGAPVVDEVQAKVADLAAQGMLVCGDPSDVMVVEQNGVLAIWGIHYRLEGGFRQQPAVALK